jgi:hypothetical protein
MTKEKSDGQKPLIEMIFLESFQGLFFGHLLVASSIINSHDDYNA